MDFELTPEFRARYHLGPLLGAGGMGRVYRAEHLGLKRTVALKLLVIELEEEAIERFLREGRAMAKVSHPNLVPVYDLDRVGRWPYLALEYLAGGNLKQRIAEGPVALEQSLPVLLECLGALAACHAQRVVHRDVKPENVLFDAGGAARLGDLGLALDADLVQRLTRTGTRVGTPLYMAPEVLLHNVYTPASDLYAIGLIMYEMLVGVYPFSRASAAALMSEQVHRAPPEPADVGRPLAPWLRELVFRLLAKDPAERPGAAVEVVEALRRGRGRSRGPARALPVAAAAPPPVRRAAPAMAGAALLIVLALVGAAVRPGRRPVAPASPASAWSAATEPAAVMRGRRNAAAVDPIASKILEIPYEMDRTLSRTAAPPGRLLAARLDGARRDRIHAEAVRRAGALLVRRPPGDLPAWLDAVQRDLSDRAVAVAERRRLYELLADLSDLDGAGELICGASLLEVDARTAGWVTVRRGIEAPPHAFHPLVAPAAPALRAWLAHDVLPVFAHRGQEFLADTPSALADWTIDGQFYAGADRLNAAVASPDAEGRVFRWYRLGELPAALHPAQGLTLWLRAADLEPNMRFWFRLGGRRRFALRTTAASHYPVIMTSSGYHPDHAELMAHSESLSAEVAPGALDDADRSLEVGADAFALTPAGDALSSRFAWLVDLAIGNNEAVPRSNPQR